MERLKTAWDRRSNLKRVSSMLQTASIGLRALGSEADANRAIYENVLLRTKMWLRREVFCAGMPGSLAMPSPR